MYHFNQTGYPVQPPRGSIDLVGHGLTPRIRRRRTTFTSAQQDALEEAFDRNHFPEQPERTQISEELGIEERRIQIWFKNRRAKFRHHLKIQQMQGVQNPHTTLFNPSGDNAQSIGRGRRRKAPTPSLVDPFHFDQNSTGNDSGDSPIIQEKKNTEEISRPIFSYADAIAALGYQETLRPASLISPAGIHESPQQQSVNFNQSETNVPSYPTTYYTDLSTM